MSNKWNNESGMTLIEILFSIMILLVLTMTSASMIRHGVDIRVVLSDQAKVTHRLTVAMQKIAQDMQHAFLISRVRDEYQFTGRSTKTIFETSVRGEGSTLKMTVMNHRALREHAKQSDQAYVVYKLERDSDTGATHLYRGESLVIPADFDEEPPMQIIAKYIKKMIVRPWDGDSFKEDWNSDRSDWRDMLPHMVEVEIEAYELNPKTEDERIDNLEEIPTTTLRTVVYLQRSWGRKEVKQPVSSLKWY